MNMIKNIAHQRYLIFTIIAISTSGCFAAQVGASVKKPIDSIGTAAMGTNGLITVQIRMDSAGAIGDVLYEIGPDDPRYQAVIQRVGGLAPGEEKFIPAFENK